ncbi:nucleoside/nucleotide kinase family protein [Paucibacter sp. R3-3]|uniref:Nucleoside/nucleotide kinase family protein n=1 Tax=Roseateles agri TaxID=3098619 RepID=A0ABU5DPH1_9BURK|nr:nucleoside/nucleotide kinase family protein [Paucibacter sp. R3-3]MDY0748225.1 nucleoside/nucleotide kinase family protein [Paucibacter sp. R3-3]
MNTPLIDHLSGLLAGGRRVMLGLVGCPGAGKSTLAESLQQAFPDIAQVVPMDGFHLANVELQRLGFASRKGAQHTFDAAGYVALLQRLRAQREGEVVYAPEFRREIEEPVAGAIPVFPETRLVITEGNYLLLDESPWARVRPLLDEVWFVDVDDTLRNERLVARHQRFGRTREAALAWIAGNDALNAEVIAATRGRADRVVHE